MKKNCFEMKTKGFCEMMRGEGWRLAGRGGRALCFAEGYDGLFRALETRLKDGVITAWRARKGEWKYGVAVKRHTAL